MNAEQGGRSTTIAPRSLADCAGLAVGQFLFHEAPMVLLDRVVEVAPGFARCTCLTDDQNPFHVAGIGVPCWVAVEFMAQCIAVAAGAAAVIDGKAIPVGLLLGTMALDCRQDAFGPEAVYEAECRRSFHDGAGLGSYDCVVLRGDEIMATARLTVKQLQEEPVADA